MAKTVKHTVWCRMCNVKMPAGTPVNSIQKRYSNGVDYLCEKCSENVKFACKEKERNEQEGQEESSGL